MDKKRKRTGLTEQNVFSNKKYKHILALFFHFGTGNEKEKIKFSHLKYALVKNYVIKSKYEKKRMEDFFISKFYREMIEKLKIRYTLNELSKVDYNAFVVFFRKGYLNELEERGWLSEKTKFSSEQGLRNAMYRIQKLGIIESKKDKKGYPFYMLTEKGFLLYLRWWVHYLIDEHLKEDVDALFKLQLSIMDRAIEKKSIGPMA